MPKAQTKASAKYNAKTYEEVKLRVFQGQKAQIQSFAESQGMSINGYINKLIADDMGEALTVPSKQQGD